MNEFTPKYVVGNRTYVYIGDLDDYIERAYLSYKFNYTNGFIDCRAYDLAKVYQFTHNGDSPYMTINNDDIISIEIINQYASFFPKSSNGLLKESMKINDEIVKCNNKLIELEKDRLTVRAMLDKSKTLNELWEDNDVKNNKQIQY